MSEALKGKSFWVVGDLVTIKATGEDTRGTLTLLEVFVPPGGGPPPHFHRREDEAFYVLEGEFSILFGDKTITAKTGDFIFLPRNVRHTFRCVGQTPGKMMVVVTPAGIENFFAEAGEPATNKINPPAPNIEKVLAACAKYDIEIEPPAES